MKSNNFADVGNGLDRSATKKRGALTSLVKGRGTIANGDGGEIYLILTPFLCSWSATVFNTIGKLGCGGSPFTEVNIA